VGRAAFLRAVLALSAAGLLATACTRSTAPGPRPDGSAITPQGWRVTPAGSQTDLGPGPLAVAASPRGDIVLVADGGLENHALVVLDPSGAILQRIGAADVRRKGLYSDDKGYASGYYAGLAFAPDGAHAYAADGPGNALHVFSVSGRTLREEREILLPPPKVGAETYPAGIAVSHDGAQLYVAGNLADALYVIEQPTGSVTARIPVGHLPYGVALNRAGTRAFVSNWGERTVSVVSTSQATVMRTIETGTHPSAVVSNPANDEIYVANSDSDSVTVLNGETGEIMRRIDLRPYAEAAIGASPNALAVSPDGGTLYAANGLDNDVAVVNLAADDAVVGLIPTGWYPSGVAADPTGGALFVINMKGRGVGPVATGTYWPSLLHGTLSRIPVPDGPKLADYTAQVRANDRFDRPPPTARSAVIPGKPGDRSPIRHVIYVLKENRTYDQILGDLGRGNGDPKLTLFGEANTPNHHQLARAFVTLDNFYVDAEVSVDGWSWSNGGYANAYIQKDWPLDYGNYNRPDDLGGYGKSETAGLPGEKPGDSFLWDALLKANIPYVNFGFYVNNPPLVDSSMHGLLGHTDPIFPGWDLNTTDQVRIDRWLQVFTGFQQAGEMPTVQFIALPGDHTSATEIGKRTPRAYVADNDLALGRLVEAVSHSRFWADTAIFVVEDDAQDGPDHVDGHRTVALVISPYTQSGKVDSTFYSTVSMLRTMELILGVPAMSQFDAAAEPMSASFSDRPNLRPYTALMPRVSLTELNGAEAPMARQSASLDFSLPDKIPMALMNEIVWRSVRGADSTLPVTQHSSLVHTRDEDGDGD
jgi:YVTN family beta-propeller protein